MIAETWAEQDLNRYLEEYAKGSEETERRKRTCAFCGDTFDIEDGKAFYLYRASHIRVNGELPDTICICGSCYRNAEEIESEDDYEV